jgi:hypothetical protein
LVPAGQCTKPKRALLSFDDQQRLAGEQEKILLVGFPVVHRHRLTGPESNEVDPDLWELLLTRRWRRSPVPSRHASAYHEH